MTHTQNLESYRPKKNTLHDKFQNARQCRKMANT